MVLVLNVDNNETLLVLHLGPFTLVLIKHTVLFHKLWGSLMQFLLLAFVFLKLSV